MYNELVQNFEFEINNKATQAFQSNKQMTSVFTQTELDPANTCKVSIQCNIEHIHCNIEQPKIGGDENLVTENDEMIMKMIIAYLIKVKLNIQAIIK